MKSLLKIVAVGSAITLGAAVLPATSYAGDREWATVGKVLTGVAAFGVLTSIIHDAGPPRGYVHVDRCAPPPPPPMCEPPRRWTPGHYECRPDRVCMPGYWETVNEPAQYAWVRHGCHSEYVMVRPACARRVWVPEHYEVRETRVWVPGHTEFGGYAYNGPRWNNRDRD